MPNKTPIARDGILTGTNSPRSVRFSLFTGSKVLFESPGFLVIIVIILTVIAFLPSLKNDFIPTWDDGFYVTDNLMIRQLNLVSVKSMFTTPINGTYIPLPLLSFAAEYHFFGLNPFPFHVSNLVLHLVCTLLVFQLLKLLKINSIFAASGALIFGIHPMHVESVAWITERKDLLYTLFYLGSLILYLQYLKKGKRPLLYFVLSLLLFILSLFSKIQAVSLPLCLLLIDYYLERPFKLKQIIEKIPYFILSLIFGVAGILVLNKQGALKYNEVSGISDNIFYGLSTLTQYIFKFFAPIRLSAFYPYPVATGQPLPLFHYLNPVILAVLGFLVYRTGKFTRAVIFGSLFFLFSIIFVLQFLPAGYAYLADRFTYLPYIGLCFIVAWSMEKLSARTPGLQLPMLIIFSVIVIVSGIVTYYRCKTWKNGETLWTDVIKKYPDQSARPYVNRGLVYWKLGQTDREIADFTRAIAIDPAFADAWYNRGNAYLDVEKPDDAIADYSMVIRLDPNFTNAYYNRGNAFWSIHNWDAAIADYSAAISLDPGYTNAYYNRGFTYATLQQWDNAIEDFTRVIEIDPKNKQAYVNRGIAYGNLELWEKAITDYTLALEIDPDLNVAYANREIAYRNLRTGTTLR